jgi:phosphatidylinositol 4-kinase
MVNLLQNNPSQILAAQTRLAHELDQRPEFYHIYLQELLSLFEDRGIAIQNASVQNRHMKAEDLAEQLVSLLLPIDALLSHADLNPRIGSSPELVALFRKMWFLCTLFQFTAADEKDGSATEWRRPALSRIAAKTPALVLEEAHDLLVSDIEFNSSIRQEYARNVSSSIDSIWAAHDDMVGYAKASRLAQQVSTVQSHANSILVFRRSHLSSRHA